MGDDLFVLGMFGMLLWMVYMYTFRTKDMMEIQRQHHDRVDKVARGAAKTGLTIFRLFKR
jgi:hypothetical protein